MDLRVNPPEVLDGIVFYPRAKESETCVIELQAEGRVKLPVGLTISPEYELRASSARSGSRLQLELDPYADGPTTVVVARTTRLPTEAVLHITSGVHSFDIPVHQSEVPRFQLREVGAAGQSVRPGQDGLRLYPTDRHGHTWQLTLHLERGAAIVTQLELEGTDGVEVTPSQTLPRLLRQGGSLDLTVTWTGQATGKRHCALKPVTRAGLDQPLALELHANRPVILSHEILFPPVDKQLFFGGETPQRVDVGLINQGGALATLESVKALMPEARLELVHLVSAKDPTNPDLNMEMPVVGGVLRPEVKEAVIPSKLHGIHRVEQSLPDHAMLVERLEFSIAAEHRPVNDRVEFGVVVKTRADERIEERTILLSHGAREISDADDGYELLIDYGTVHTCAMVHASGSAAGDLGEPLIVLNTPNEAAQTGTRYEMKSTYRVMDWKSEQFGFGLEAWAGLARYIASTDFASKLRLGTLEKRPLRDANVAVRGVSGRMAARCVLGEVLRRVKEERGLNFKRIRLTHPAAFNECATDDLREALVELDFAREAITFPCSEPEAFLYSLGQHRRLISELTARYSRADREPGRGVLGIVFDFGGGTTDITVFEFHARRGRPELRVVASHGYSWLGGERVTELLAAHLLTTVGDHERFRFPEVGEPGKANAPDGPRLKGHLLDPSVGDVQHNYGKLREIAEAAKCDPADRGAGSVELMDEFGGLHRVDLAKTEGDESSGLKGVVTQMVRLALEDIDHRLSLMSEWGVISDLYPECVAVAGNSGRLWCLEEIIRSHLEERNIDPIYWFDSESAKTGVLLGLKDYMEAPMVPVVSSRATSGTRGKTVLRTSRWWFILAQGNHHLALPAGVRLDVDQAPDSLADALPVSVFATGPMTLSTGPGPGPEDGVKSHRSALYGIQHAGQVPLPEGLEAGAWVRLRMGCRGGQLGLWFWVDEDEHPLKEQWRWSPLVQKGGK